MWWRLRCKASIRCWPLANRTIASPLRRPLELKHKAIPPLPKKVNLPLQNRNCEQMKSTNLSVIAYLGMSRPKKSRARSTSEACHGRPRVRTTVSSEMPSCLLQRCFVSLLLFFLVGIHEKPWVCVKLAWHTIVQIRSAEISFEIRSQKDAERQIPLVLPFPSFVACHNLNLSLHLPV